MSNRLRTLAKKLVYGYVPGFAGSFPYFGSKVFFPHGALIFDLICEQGVFEPEIVNLLTKLAKPDTTVFDVGANIGLMALPMLHACSTCQVVSFEPSPNSLPFLRQTVEKSNHRNRWLVVEKALGDVEGQVNFFLGDPKSSMLEGFGGHRNLAGQRSVTVPVSTLDKEWQDLGKPPVSLIKIDVEGAEGLVLRGARALMKTIGPDLVVEWYAEYLRPFGTPPELLFTLSQEFDYRLFSIPMGVPINDLATLRVQMLICSNFLLAKRVIIEGPGQAV